MYCSELGVEMRVVVQSLTPTGMTIESEIGQVSGRWRESSRAPQVGQWLNVEIGIDWVACGAEVVDAENLTASLQVESETNIIVGRMEVIDEDKMGFLRLTPDCIVMVETDGALTPGNWVRMRIPSSSTEIFGGVIVIHAGAGPVKSGVCALRPASA
jgi:hypothetical protein